MRLLWTILLSLGAIYCGLVLLLFFFQSKLAHLPNLPGRELVATPKAIGLDYQEVYFNAADGVRLHGWLIPAENATTALLFLHGNAGNISHRLDSIKVLHQLGINILIFDYRGYGQSQGQVSEQGLYRDAEAAFDYLQKQRGFDTDHIVIFGRSLGASVAAWLAARRQYGALILESAFTSALDIAAEVYPLFPARLLVRLRYQTLHNLQQTQRPVLIVHSRDDEIIPYQHGQRLYQAAHQPKRMLTIGGDHNGGFLQSASIYQQGLRDFLTAFVPTMR